LIWVTRLNGERLVINAELIETVEANPDTTITLLNGDRYIVKEPVEEIVEQVIEYKRKIFFRFFEDENSG